MKMKQFNSLLKRINWVNALFLVFSPLIVWFYIPLDIIQNGLSQPLIITFVILSVFTGISITAGYHRLFAHRSYEANNLFKLFFLIFGATALQGSALKWSTDHRRHHRFVDTNTDPYSIKKGFWYAHIGWIFFKEDEQYKNKYLPDLEQDKLISWQHKYYFAIGVIVGFLFPAFIGYLFGDTVGGLMFGGFARVVFTHHCTFLINSACHYFGTQPYGTENTARDSMWLAFFTYGEGYHNFHHKFQIDYRNGIKWYQWDPTKWLIWTSSKLGWTWNLRRVSNLEILKAKMKFAEQKLPEDSKWKEQAQNIRLRVEELEFKLSKLKKSYYEIKQHVSNHRHVSNMKSTWDHGIENIETIKLEMKLAKIEMSALLNQWKILVKRSSILST